MILPPEQSQAALNATKAMTRSSSVSIESGSAGDMIIRVGRAGRSGWQDMEYTITPGGKKTVMQFGFNENLELEHFDPKVLEPYVRPQ
jgi:hypothetical protein